MATSNPRTLALRAIESCRVRWTTAPTHVAQRGRKNRHKHNAKITNGNETKLSRLAYAHGRVLGGARRRVRPEWTPAYAVVRGAS